MSEENWIIQKVKQAGGRTTNNRIIISNWIHERHGLFTVHDIICELPELDAVGVYRTVELLVSIDCIHEVGNRDGHMLYEIHLPENHHHHIVCLLCEKTRCVPCSYQAPQIKGFTQVHHVVQLAGVCDSCS